jgi:hypothetical protein
MRELGINVVRVYHVPPLWFLDRCSGVGMRVLITLPWAKHIEFLRKKAARDAIADSVRKGVAENAGHPAIFGYLVGNEIASTMVRWLGVRRVKEFVEHLISVGRAENPDVLFSYASYPPTEFLLPQNVDFLCLNVYLHNQPEFERYLLRLQNLAEERPLILGEFGMDTIRHTQDEQAEMLGWHVDSVIKCGLAGTIFFAWTDEWFTGEQEITDWAFGIVTRETSLIVLEFVRGTRARRAGGETSWASAFTSLVGRNRRRYGGYVVHAAIVLLAIGIAGSSAYDSVVDGKLRRGQALSVSGYTVLYRGLIERDTPHATEVRALLAVERGGENLGKLEAGKNSYKIAGPDPQVSSEVGIRTDYTTGTDLFVIADQINDDGTVYFRIFVKPLVNLIWLAGVVFLLGSLIALWPDAREERRLVLRYDQAGSPARGR